MNKHLYLCHPLVLSSPTLVYEFLASPASLEGGGGTKTLSLGPEPALSSPGYGMGGSEVRTPVMARAFILYTRSESSGANAFSFPQAKRTERGVNHPPSSSTEVCACTVCHEKKIE